MNYVMRFNTVSTFGGTSDFFTQRIRNSILFKGGNSVVDVCTMIRIHILCVCMRSLSVI